MRKSNKKEPTNQGPKVPVVIYTDNQKVTVIDIRMVPLKEEDAKSIEDLRTK